MNAEKKELKLSKEKKSRSDFSFQTGQRFNISITFKSTAEVIPVQGGA